MTRIFHIFVSTLIFLLAAGAAMAGPQVQLLRAETSGWFSRETVVEILLDAPAAFRVGTQQEDGLLHIDLIDTRIAPEVETATDTVLSTVRMGRLDLDTARISLGLTRRVEVVSAAMQPRDTGAQLTLVLAVSATRTPTPEPVVTAEDGLPVIVLDPGHGGIDPGAIRDGISEKDIALAFALELRTALEAHGGYHVVMTRETDLYLSLRERVRVARAADAVAFISLHANTVTRGNASGAAVYTLSEEASDAEAAALAALENRADAIGGAELDAGDDDLALLLTDMTQRQTNARSAQFARQMVSSLRGSVGVIRSNPHRSAGFRVLKAPDIPSLLVELGFLSDAGDRANMVSPRWRARAIAGIIEALDSWAAADSRLAQRELGATPVTSD